jgi:hypothetical protein
MRTFYDPEAGTEVEESDFLDSIEASETARNEYREASQRMLVFMFDAVNFIRDAKSATEMRFRIDLLGYFLGLPQLAAMSEDDIGLRYDKSRAAVSNELLKFQRRNQVNGVFQELLAQKKSSSRKAYHKTRKAQLVTQ